jgi:lysyl endopeptidase
MAGALPLAAHVGAPPLSAQRAVLPLAALPQVVLSPVDAAKELSADGKTGKPLPLRFAVPQQVALDPANCGTWEQLSDGRLWRLRVVSTNATDLNFGFGRFSLPEGATLHISAESEPYFQGPYTAEDNQPDGQLWTAVVPGGAAVLELFVPTQAEQDPQLLLTRVGTGFRDFFHKARDLSIARPKAPATTTSSARSASPGPTKSEA